MVTSQDTGDLLQSSVLGAGVQPRLRLGEEVSVDTAVQTMVAPTQQAWVAMYGLGRGSLSL